MGTLPSWISSNDLLYGGVSLQETSTTVQLKADEQLPGNPVRTGTVTFGDYLGESVSKVLVTQEPSSNTTYDIRRQAQSTKYKYVGIPEQVVPILLRVSDITPLVYLDGTDSTLLNAGYVTVKYISFSDVGNLGRSYPSPSHPKWTTARRTSQTEYIVGPFNGDVDPFDINTYFSGYVGLFVKMPPIVDSGRTVCAMFAQAGLADTVNTTETFTVQCIAQDEHTETPTISFRSHEFTSLNLTNELVTISGRNLLVKFQDLNSRVGGMSKLKFAWTGYSSQDTVDLNMLYGGDILICPTANGVMGVLTIQGGQFIVPPSVVEQNRGQMYLNVVVEDLITGNKAEDQIWISL